MNKISLNEIKKIIDDLAEKINAPKPFLPSYGQMQYDAHPYIDVDSSGSMYYVVSERGTEFERKKTTDITELCFWVFDSVTHRMAVEYELENRIDDQDHRRIIFAKQEELLGKLNDEWKQAIVEHHKKILVLHPFDDHASLRANFCGQLRKQGYSEGEIRKLAYEKYPAMNSK